MTKRTPWKPQWSAEHLWSLYQQCGTCTAVAHALGVSGTRVYHAMDYYGLPRKRLRRSPEKRTVSDETLMYDYEKGDTIKELARRHGVSQSTMRRWLVHAGASVRETGLPFMFSPNYLRRWVTMFGEGRDGAVFEEMSDLLVELDTARGKAR